MAVGNATARAIWLKPRDERAYYYENSCWYTGFVGGDYRWFMENGQGARNMDARTLFFYSATVNTPAKDFWSVIVYDPQRRSELQTDQTFPSVNNKKTPLVYNDDGSVDLYYGPEAPVGKESNWTQTVPGKGWFVLIRLYGPLKPWFDRRWQPGDFERVV